MKRVIVAIAAVLVALPALALATGRIEGPDGAPIAGAEVCEQLPGSPEHCVKSDAHGLYRMESPLLPSLFVRASGFVAITIQAAPLDAPVRLMRAATLKVAVVDASSGSPLVSGRVMVDSPSGKRIGDFVPFNKAGVRIATLAPGEVLVRAESYGYQPGGPETVTLESGVERSVTIRMKKKSGPSSR